jgi:hypothetical protein
MLIEFQCLPTCAPFLEVICLENDRSEVPGFQREGLIHSIFRRGIVAKLRTCESKPQPTGGIGLTGRDDTLENFARFLAVAGLQCGNRLLDQGLILNGFGIHLGAL